MARKEQDENKTGGTPDGGRMEPGKEGRGGARRQHRPEILTDPTAALETLEKKALSVAEFMGHDAFVWRVDSTGTSGQLKCRTCNKKAGFAETPMSVRVVDPADSKKTILQPKEQINGCIVEERCGG